MKDLITLDKIGTLEDYEISSVDLSDEYWTPENDGEQRRLVFYEIAKRMVPDHADKSKNIELNCAIFLQPGPDGMKTVVNASVRLVAVFENNEIESGTPVQITYLGIEKNKSNANKSARWSVVLLKKKGK